LPNPCLAESRCSYQGSLNSKGISKFIVSFTSFEA
jgi:hypothetical protein